MTLPFLPIPLAPGKPTRLPRPGPAAADGPGAARLRFTRHGMPIDSGRDADAVAAVPAPGPRHGTLRGSGFETEFEIAPVLLASSREPVERLFVVENALTRSFVARLRALDLAPVTAVPQSDDNPDIWMQDAVEFGVAPYRDRGRTRQTPMALLGLRAEHDEGLACGPLDAAVEAALQDTGAVRPATPLSGRRWIDWYGNLEATPPLPGFPFGRILFGNQRGLTPHPDLLDFLRDQTYQWPPVVGDVSWLTIGHIDEILGFVPARRGRGWRAVFASPRRARRLLEAEVEAGRGGDVVMPGTPHATTARRLLDTVANSASGRACEAAAERSADDLADRMGLKPSERIAIPCLFQNGAAVLPNPVNALVVGNHIVASDPLYPPFARAIREAFDPLGLHLHLLDVFEPYHVRGGEIHCATNAVRRLRRAAWWRTSPRSGVQFREEN